MKIFELKIDAENAAFDGDPRGELAWILEAAARRIRRGCAFPHKLRDHNGNSVGEMRAVGSWPFEYWSDQEPSSADSDD